MKFIEKLLSKNSFKKLTSGEIGAFGEDRAENLLKKQGYIILERNYRVKGGEIDIIAKDGEYTCFVEVRLRKNSLYGSPAESVDKYKQMKIIRAAKMYALKHNLYDTPMRFDVVAIDCTADSVEVIKDAFQL